MQAAERIDGDDKLVLGYTRQIWSRMNNDLDPAPNVLFVGGGGYTLPTHLLASRDDAAAVVVEIDPLVTKVARNHMSRAGEMIDRVGHGAATDDGRLTIVHDDGRVYLNEAKGKFDAAVMDAFSSNSVPAHLVTRESFARLRQIVTGPVYVSLIDRPDGPLVKGVNSIMSELWPVVVVEQGPVRNTGRANIVLVAAPDTLRVRDLSDGYAQAPHPRLRMTGGGSATANPRSRLRYRSRKAHVDPNAPR